MTPLAEFLAVLHRNDLNMNAERREFAKRVADVVVRNSRGREAFDPVLYVLALAEVDRGFDRLYGRFRGDFSARFLQLILERIRAASALPFRREAEDVRRRLPAPIWRAIQREAA